MLGVEHTPLLLGHRGSRSSPSVAENTTNAFDLALQHGCDGFEFDVRRTRDAFAVVCHDPRSCGLSIAKATRLRVPDLPLLDDVLERFGKSAFLDIELKVPGLAPALLLALNEHVPERGYVVSSFLPEVVLELAARSEATPLGIIFERRIPRWWELPVDFVIPEQSLITADLIHKVHDSGKKLLAWTVNDRAAMLRLAGWDVDGIISDQTELLVKTLRHGQVSQLRSDMHP
jgi:glycerophosphoryl diester phosphodiesterase